MARNFRGCLEGKEKLFLVIKVGKVIDSFCSMWWNLLLVCVDLDLKLFYI